MKRRTAARAAKWRGRRDTSDAHQQLRALRKLELIEEIQAGFLRIWAVHGCDGKLPYPGSCIHELGTVYFTTYANYLF